jgi:hypothetical protein
MISIINTRNKASSFFLFYPRVEFSWQLFSSAALSNIGEGHWWKSNTRFLLTHIFENYKTNHTLHAGSLLLSSCKFELCREHILITSINAIALSSLELVTPKIARDVSFFVRQFDQEWPAQSQKLL